MSRPSANGCGAAGLGHATLLTLTDVVDGGLGLDAGDPARLVRVRLGPAGGIDDDELELGFRTLEAGDHPLDVLLGFRAPEDWAATGVAATGRALPLDGGATVVGAGGVVRRTPAGARGAGRSVPVRSVHLVDRSGAWASRWRRLRAGAGSGGSGRSPDDPEDPEHPGRPGRPGAAQPAEHPDDDLAGGSASSGDTGELPSGRLDDALRLALGLPTAPPECDTRLLWAVQWLDELLVVAAASRSGRARLRPGPALVGPHPAIRAFDLDPAVIDVERLVAEGARLASWRDWTGLRRACAQGAADPVAGYDVLPPTLAAWCDDGAFARWVLAEWPDLLDLRDALAELLAPAAVAVLDRALAGWGLLDRPAADVAPEVTTDVATDVARPTVPEPGDGAQ